MLIKISDKIFNPTLTNKKIVGLSLKCKALLNKTGHQLSSHYEI